MAKKHFTVSEETCARSDTLYHTILNICDDDIMLCLASAVMSVNLYFFPFVARQLFPANNFATLSWPFV